MDTLPAKELSLRDLLWTLKRHRRLIFLTVLSTTLLALFYSLVSTPKYQAMGSLQVQKSSPDAVGLQSLISADNGGTDALATNIDLQTQASILQSNSLALSTIKILQLQNTKDFQPHWSLIGSILGLLSPGVKADPPGAGLADSPRREAQLTEVFHKNLKVTAIGGTRLIQIEYLSSDPRIAADVIQALMKGLVDYTFQTRLMATTQTSEWLTGQLAELRKQSELLQAKVVNLQRQTGVYNLGTTDSQGHEQAYSGVLDRLQQATSALTQAQQNSILKGAIAKASENGNAESLSGLAGNASAQPMNSLAVVQTLRQQEATQQALLVQAEAKYGSSFPRVIELRANIAGLETTISQEIGRIRQRATSDYAVAMQTEANTRHEYDMARRQAAKLNDKAVEFAAARQDADQSRTLYEDLLKRLKEAGILQGLRSSNVTVVDPAQIPGRPKSPNGPVYIGIGLLSGLLLGALAAILLDAFDEKLRTVRSTSNASGLDIACAVPLSPEVARWNAAKASSAIKPFDQQNSAFAEAILCIRSALSLPRKQNSVVFLVTSCNAGEGKSTLSSALAVAFAQSGYRVLLVDAQLKVGQLDQAFGLPVGIGLSELLAGRNDELPARQSPCHSGLDVIAAGSTSPHEFKAANLTAFSSLVEQWRERYDFIFIDSPPLIPRADALLLQPVADRTLLVIRSGFTEKAQLDRCLRLITKDDSVVPTILFNGVRPDDDSYTSYFGIATPA